MDCAAIEAGGWNVRFERRGDRFFHTIALIDHGQSAPLLESIEGNDVEIWPASPPLQSIHLEDRPEGVRVALLVGMAGSSHWSMSCEVTPEGNVTFDVACRTKQIPQWLGSGYRTANGVCIAPMDDPTGLILQWGDIACRLHAMPRIASLASELRVSAAMPADVPATVRWKYSLSRQPATGIR